MSPVFASSTTRSGTSAEPTDANAFATSASWPVMVWPCGMVTVASSGVVFPPLWKAAMILFAAVSPGCPGNEKFTVIRSVTVLATAPPATAITTQATTTSSRCRSTISPRRRMVDPSPSRSTEASATAPAPASGKTLTSRTDRGQRSSL